MFLHNVYFFKVNVQLLTKPFSSLMKNTQPKLIKKDEYLNHLLGKKEAESEKKSTLNTNGEKIDIKLLKEAYKNALDTRKFEIDLYWKRTKTVFFILSQRSTKTHSVPMPTNKQPITLYK